MSTDIKKNLSPLDKFLLKYRRLRMDEKQKELLIKRYKGQVAMVVMPVFLVPTVNKVKKDSLAVFTYAKALGKYIYQVTAKAPVKFRYTFTNNLQLSSNRVLECLYRANQYRKDSPEPARLRKKYQMDAYTELRMLSYFAMLAHENNCILSRHYENIAKHINNTLKFLSAWMHEK